MLKIAGGSASGHVATGTPLLGELAALGGVCQRGLRGSGCEHKGHHYNCGNLVGDRVQRDRRIAWGR